MATFLTAPALRPCLGTGSSAGAVVPTVARAWERSPARRRLRGIACGLPRAVQRCARVRVMVGSGLLSDDKVGPEQIGTQRSARSVRRMNNALNPLRSLLSDLPRISEGLHQTWIVEHARGAEAGLWMHGGDEAPWYLEPHCPLPARAEPGLST